MKILKKKLTKKQDKVMKVAMKIEKKQQREDRINQTSISQPEKTEIGVKQKLAKKKEKREARKEKSPKMAKDSWSTKQLIKAIEKSQQNDQQKNNIINYPIMAATEFPLTLVKNFPVVPVAPQHNVITEQPRNTGAEASITHMMNTPQGNLKWARRKQTVADQLFLRQLSAGQSTLETDKKEGKLANAVYLSEKNRFAQQVDRINHSQFFSRVINHLM